MDYKQGKLFLGFFSDIFTRKIKWQDNSIILAINQVDTCDYIIPYLLVQTRMSHHNYKIWSEIVHVGGFNLPYDMNNPNQQWLQDSFVNFNYCVVKWS